MTSVRRFVNDRIIELTAEAWASIDGKLEEFRLDRAGRLNPTAGHYEGYKEDAAELLRRLNARGLGVVVTVPFLGKLDP
jgi:hypothetical protein